MQKKAGEQQSEERLKKLQLADSGAPTESEPAIPEHKAHEHAEYDT